MAKKARKKTIGKSNTTLEKVLALAHTGKNKEEIKNDLQSMDIKQVEKKIEEMKHNFRSEFIYGNYMTEFTMKKDFVIGQLMTIYAKAMAEEPVIDKDGIPTGEYKADFRAALKAVELIGRELGMFKNNLVIEDITKKQRAHDLIAEYKEVMEIKSEKKSE